MKKICSFLLLLALTAYEIPAVVRGKELQIQLKHFIEESEARTALWGICVHELDTGNPVVEYRADKVFTPASNMKMWTSVTALEHLPAHFKFRTSVYSTAPVREGHVTGDIVLYGRGDPTLQTCSLQQLAHQLKESGITRIDGNVIVCEGYFDGPRIQHQWEVMDIPLSYGVEVSALTINNNVFKLNVIPASLGESATIMVDDLIQSAVINKTQTVSGEEMSIALVRDLASNDIEAVGKIGSNTPPVERVRAICNIPLYAGRLFKRVLEEQEINVQGEVMLKPYYEEGRELAFVESKSLAEIIHQMNKENNNLTAELLLHAIGKKNSAALGTTRERGLAALKTLAHKVSAPSNSYSFADGSGLSKHSVISPEAMVKLLRYAYRQPYRDVFIKSLPIAGFDGTLAQRFVRTFGEHKILAKTGTMGKVTSLSGYATTKSGTPVAFSLLVNNHVVPPLVARAVLDAVVIKILEAH